MDLTSRNGVVFWTERGFNKMIIETSKQYYGEGIGLVIIFDNLNKFMRQQQNFNNESVLTDVLDLYVHKKFRFNFNITKNYFIISLGLVTLVFFNS